MLDVIEVFDVMRLDPATGHPVWVSRARGRPSSGTGTRSIRRPRRIARSNGSTSAAISMPSSRDGIRGPGGSDNEKVSRRVQDRAAMSRKSMLSRSASGLVEPELPLRGYFLWVGGALLLLLLAAGWALPAPAPSPLTDAHSALPPMRIRSDTKGPEAVVIDTSGLEQRARPAEHDMAAEAPSRLSEAHLESGDETPTQPTDLRLRQSLAQSEPDVHDHAGETAIAARERKRDRAHPVKRRHAPHPAFANGDGACGSSIRERRDCRYAWAPN
ncbi:hypothetical protein ABIB94_007386 [Bradyrhizobium sp. JR7.2]